MRPILIESIDEESPRNAYSSVQNTVSSSFLHKRGSSVLSVNEDLSASRGSTNFMEDSGTALSPYDTVINKIESYIQR